MAYAETINMSDVMKATTITFRVTGARRLKARVWLGAKVLWLGAIIMGAGHVVVETTPTP